MTSEALAVVLSHEQWTGMAKHNTDDRKAGIVPQGSRLLCIHVGLLYII